MLEAHRVEKIGSAYGPEGFLQVILIWIAALVAGAGSPQRDADPPTISVKIASLAQCPFQARNFRYTPPPTANGDLPMIATWQSKSGEHCTLIVSAYSLVDAHELTRGELARVEVPRKPGSPPGSQQLPALANGSQPVLVDGVLGLVSFEPHPNTSAIRGEARLKIDLDSCELVVWVTVTAPKDSDNARTLAKAELLRLVKGWNWKARSRSVSICNPASGGMTLVVEKHPIPCREVHGRGWAGGAHNGQDFVVCVCKQCGISRCSEGRDPN